MSSPRYTNRFRRSRPTSPLALLALLYGAGCDGDPSGATNDTRPIPAHTGAAPLIPAASTPAAPPDDGRSAGISDELIAGPEGLLPPEPSGLDTGFLGRPEGSILRHLHDAQVVGITKGGGGRSLGFKLTLAGGDRAYYKPEQSFSGTLWYAEVVAHYLDRALGLGRVPPVVARSLPWAPLRAAAAGDGRIPEVTVGDAGQVKGALVHWLDTAPLTRALTPPGWENWVRVEPFARWSISPYQRPATYADQLRARKAPGASDGDKRAEPYYDVVPRPGRPGLPGELSDMLVFDFLTLNIDRWGGDNVNVLTLGENGPLVFLDNAAGFSEGPDRRGLMDDRLSVCQRFRRATVRALESLNVEALGARMAQDPLAPLLSGAMLEGLEVRRRAVLDHVSAQHAKFGDALWLQ